MPAKCSIQNVQSLKELVMAATAANIAREVDFEFFKDITDIPNSPEYSRYNNKCFRDSGLVLNQRPSACTHH